MIKINRSALVPYSAADMFALVDDIDAYKEFLPWCSNSHVLVRDESGVRGEIELRKGKVRKSFITQNINQQDESITMQLVEGPFKHLEGVWLFQSLKADASKVMLELEYEFSNALLKMTVGPVFQQVADRLVDAFCQRANDIYGQGNE